MKTPASATAILLFLFLAGCGSTDVRTDVTVSVVKHPDTATRNAFYVSNRPPLLPSPLVKLPIGAITPRGWLEGQLHRMATGMIGRLAEVSRFLKAEKNAWLSPDGVGHSPWEEVPYWLKGFGDLGYVLKDRRIMNEARVWIDAILASQDADGWFGPRVNKKKHDCWPNMIALNCLQSFHEATGDARVLPFMTRYFRWQLDIPRDHLLPGSWQKIRGGDNLESIYWLYNRTGHAFLLELAKALHDRTADWTGGIASWHGVNICQGFREPGEYYIQSKDRTFLDATYRNYHTVMDLYGQVPGGMFGADENCRRGYHGPRQAAETCSMVEFMHSFEMLLRITGDPVWADRCEEVAFNSLPASLTADMKGLHYLTAPNMVQLDGGNKSPGVQNRGCMLAYSPHRYRCCQHNVSHGWPYFVEELWLATPDNGLAAVLYAPCKVSARVGGGVMVTVMEQTDYPFDENIRFTLSCRDRARFPLYLRIPQWCTSARISVNGTIIKCNPEPLSYVVLHRTWQNRDRVEVTFPMPVDVKLWETNGSCVSVHRGPLAYSLKIGERWEKSGGEEAWQKHEKADLKSTPEWPAYEVFPTTPWNYGLVVDGDNPEQSFEVVRKPGPLEDQPFTVDGSPIELLALAFPIPNWKMEDGLAGPMQPGPVRSEGPSVEVTLIPMGCARLRISAFPLICNGPGALDWVVRARPRASHCFESDTTRALNDGAVPKSSNDSSIPRMTWWDHRGTSEWVAYDFEEPRKLSFAEVYWFDDTGRGHCRTPASWRLLYLDGKTWRPAKNTSPYTSDRDGFNRVSFEPVVTRGLKVEVNLRKNFSGGILEWRIGLDTQQRR